MNIMIESINGDLKIVLKFKKKICSFYYLNILMVGMVWPSHKIMLRGCDYIGLDISHIALNVALNDLAISSFFIIIEIIALSFPR